tara:strand:+ start:1503 stop:2399 length:897 start_codon:yes stop_codon:yes gene_type:complete
MVNVDFDAINAAPDAYDYFNNSVVNSGFLAMIFIVIVGYWVLFTSLGALDSGSTASSGSTSSDSSSNSLEIILWAAFVLLLILNGLQYFFSVNVTASLKDIFTSEPKVDIAIKEPRAVPSSKDVDDGESDGESDGEGNNGGLLQTQTFHIPGNKYTFSDAKALCQAYGAELASVKDVQDAYKKGGEWCSYGWSKDQMALYPTQDTSWSKLQSIPGHEHDCGRPGVNGGYIANPNVRFGVNCKGAKRQITPEERERMDYIPQYPLTNDEIKFNKKVSKMRKHLKDINISPFNYNNWSAA